MPLLIFIIVALAVYGAFQLSFWFGIALVVILLLLVGIRILIPVLLLRILLGGQAFRYMKQIRKRRKERKGLIKTKEKK